MQQTANICKLVYSQGQTDVDYKRLTILLNYRTTRVLALEEAKILTCIS